MWSIKALGKGFFVRENNAGAAREMDKDLDRIEPALRHNPNEIEILYLAEAVLIRPEGQQADLGAARIDFDSIAAWGLF